MAHNKSPRRSIRSRPAATASRGLRGGAEKIHAQQADRCRPNLCALGATPHAHCPCGLPMAAGATLCDLCRSEELRPTGLKAAGYLEEWDGRSYPSLRRNRPTDVPRERYEAFLGFVLGPVVRGAQPSTAGEAA